MWPAAVVGDGLPHELERDVKALRALVFLTVIQLEPSLEDSFLFARDGDEPWAQERSRCVGRAGQDEEKDEADYNCEYPLNCAVTVISYP